MVLTSSSCNRKRRSTPPDGENCNQKHRRSSALMDMSLSPASLVRKLDQISTKKIEKSEAVVVELGGFTKNCASLNTTEYEKQREAIRQMASDPENFDVGGRTELKMDDAAVAGAKLLLDEHRATRSMSKMLKERCGIDEDEVLYKPLSYTGIESNQCREINDVRKASVVESLVDFKKQIEFKSSVLHHYAHNAGNVSRSEGKITRSKAEKMEKAKKGRKPIKIFACTPRMQRELNPLDGDRIIDQYALEVASVVRDASKKQRRIAPIPFNINLLDEEEEDEKMET